MGINNLKILENVDYSFYRKMILEFIVRDLECDMKARKEIVTTVNHVRAQPTNKLVIVCIYSSLHITNYKCKISTCIAISLTLSCGIDGFDN
jgi:hypothetical protein